MFAMVVVVVLPSGSVMAARNLTAIMQVPVPEIALAALLLGVAVAVNLRGRMLGSAVERSGAVVLVAALIGVVTWSLLHPTRSPDVLPDGPALALVPAGALIAFWAFIGFENLTFLARELPDPRRDFAPVAMTTLALLLALVLALTMAVVVQTAQADPVTGVVDAVRSTPWGGVVAGVLAASGLLGMALNAVAWTRGVGT
ncbi:amino acid permease, partial [Burkholderia multivorans]|uniref:amino acid permease n=1 Tax=Burkholderia multivorans TaxID=87883 RepID=UPI0015EB9F84